MLSNCDVEQHRRADHRIIRDTYTYQMHDVIRGLGDPTELTVRTLVRKQHIQDSPKMREGVHCDFVHVSISSFQLNQTYSLLQFDK
jgi:hypothetical protein